MTPQNYEVKSNRWYRLTLRGGILRLERGGEGKAPIPYEINEITIFVDSQGIVVQYPDRTDATVSQKFVWNYVAIESSDLFGHAWIVVDLGLDVTVLRLKMQ